MSHKVGKLIRIGMRRSTPTNILRYLLVGLLCTPLYAGVGGGPFVSGFLRGSAGSEVITDAVILANGNIAFCGWVDAPNVWGQAPGWQHTDSGGEEAFIAIVTSNLQSTLAFTLLGGNSNDRATGIATDHEGRIYVVGTTESTNFPTTSGTIDPIYNSYTDGFLACFSPDLKELKYGTYIGGSGNDIPADIVIDDIGSVYICGTTTSASGFPTNNGLFKTLNGNSDGFVMRLSTNAATVQFSTFFGGTSQDGFTSLALDNSGTIVLTGHTSSADFPMFPAIDPTWWWYYNDRPYDWTYNEGNSDAVLTVLSQDGARAISSTYFGGTGADKGTGVTIIESTIYIVGTTSSNDMPTIAGLQAQLRGKSDLFIASFKENGRVLTTATYFGGTGEETSATIVPYRKSLVAISGRTNSTDFPSRGYLTNSDNRGAMDAFVMIGSGSSYTVATTMGGSRDEIVTGGIPTANGGVIVYGSSSSASIALSNSTLTANGEPPTTDAMGILFERGAIDLGQPYGGERFCEGAVMRFSWAQNEMEPDDVFSIEYSTDLDAWHAIASNITGSKYDWKVDATVPLNSAYYVRVSSGRGHTSHSVAAVRLDQAPKVTQQPVGTLLLCLGTTSTLSAVVSGEDLTYQWLRNSTEISGATEPTLELSADAPAGAYSLRYRAACGTTGVTTACSVATGKPVQVTLQPESDTVVVGTPLTLTVVAKGSGLHYQWFKDGSQLLGATSSTLYLGNAEESNSGAYHCMIVGDCDSSTSAVATILVRRAMGVAGLDTEQGVLYPNPSTGLFTIRLERVLPMAAELVAFGSVGNRIAAWHFAQGERALLVDASALPSGTYTLELHGGMPFRCRVVIVH